MWVVEQRDPAEKWSIVRATVDERQDAEHYARLYKASNPKLRFCYRPVDDQGDPLDGSEPTKSEPRPLRDRR
jgi:hypothetical protein